MRPEGDGLLVGWLLSRHHLSELELESVARRIRAGETIRVSERMLERARMGLGRHHATDPGLDATQRRLLLACSLLLTPLPAWAAWWFWRGTWPTSSHQAFWLAFPATVLFTVAVPLSWRSL